MRWQHLFRLPVLHGRPVGCMCQHDVYCGELVQRQLSSSRKLLPSQSRVLHVHVRERVGEQRVLCQLSLYHQCHDSGYLPSYVLHLYWILHCFGLWDRILSEDRHHRVCHEWVQPRYLLRRNKWLLLRECYVRSFHDQDCDYDGNDNRGVLRH